MEITRQQTGDILTLTLVGRLDATWAGHVQSAISAGVRSGAHRIHLDMEKVAYLSSAGISSLLNAYKELSDIQGELAIPRYSEAVRTVLDLSGLGNLLSGASIFPDAPAAGATPAESATCSGKKESPHAIYEIHTLGQLPPQKCRVHGDPSRLPGAAFGPADCQTVEFPEGALALGLGAFGSDFADCQNRFGEILAVAGTGASQPSDGSQTPDYIVSEGALIPKFHLLHGIACHGRFSKLIRFEPKAEGDRAGLEEIARLALEAAGTPIASIVLVAETASLVGATLQRSPVGAAAGSIYAFPGVRDWFSFTAERAYANGVSVVVGVVAKNPPATLAPFVRPVGRDAELRGHFHAAAFSYRPVQKGKIDLKDTVRGLFQNQNLQGLLHLLADWRDVTGAGESEFFRGACWVSPAELA